MGYLTIVHEVLKRERFKSAWLQSPYFYGDLERLYSLHLPTSEEWKTHLKVVYHPLLNKNNSNNASNKIKYEKQFSVIQDILDE